MFSNVAAVDIVMWCHVKFIFPEVMMMMLRALRRPSVAGPLLRRPPVSRPSCPLSVSAARAAAATLVDTDGCVVLSKPVNPFQMNQHLVLCRRTSRAALVDCGDPADLWADELAELGATVESLLQTHAHIDHVLGLAAAKRAHPAAPIRLHPDDRPLYDGASAVGEKYGLPCEVSCNVP